MGQAHPLLYTMNQSAKPEYSSGWACPIHENMKPFFKRPTLDFSSLSNYTSYIICTVQYLLLYVINSDLDWL
jgi:hypothetical protein